MHVRYSRMRSHVLLFGLLCGALLALLQLIEYRWLVVERSLELYGAVVGAVFAATGIWLGRRLTTPKERVVERVVEVRAPAPFVRNAAQVEALGLTPRELEILGLIAEGLSTREIAARVHVSENTVKTHAGRVYEKLGARRRTQAVQRGKELGLLA